MAMRSVGTRSGFVWTNSSNAAWESVAEVYTAARSVGTQRLPVRRVPSPSKAAARATATRQTRMRLPDVPVFDAAEDVVDERHAELGVEDMEGLLAVEGAFGAVYPWPPGIAQRCTRLASPGTASRHKQL
jgi:hypothetical protein